MNHEQQKQAQQDERGRQLLTLARNHIIQWWRPEGSLPPAKSPQLVEDIDAYLASPQQAHPADTQDAERYRWLRQYQGKFNRIWRGWCDREGRDDELDAAIDAAKNYAQQEQPACAMKVTPEQIVLALNTFENHCGGYLDSMEAALNAVFNAQQEQPARITGTDLLCAVYKRPDLTPEGRQQFIQSVMMGEAELTLTGGDFDAMAASIYAQQAQPAIAPK